MSYVSLINKKGKPVKKNTQLNLRSHPEEMVKYLFHTFNTRHNYTEALN